MIQLIERGDIFMSGAHAIVVTTNTRGVHGAGIALKAKERYPATAEQYTNQCRRRLIAPGSLWAGFTTVGGADQWLLFVATKDHWRYNSRIEWVEQGLAEIVRWCRENRPTSVAVPGLGCGLGGLSWPEVREMMMSRLAELPDTMAVMVFAPHEREHAQRRVNQRPRR